MIQKVRVAEREGLGLGLGLGSGLGLGLAQDDPEGALGARVRVRVRVRDREWVRGSVCPTRPTLHQVRKSEMTQAMDDADYHRIFAETGTNTLEVALGAEPQP